MLRVSTKRRKIQKLNSEFFCSFDQIQILSYGKEKFTDLYLRCGSFFVFCDACATSVLSGAIQGEQFHDGNPENHFGFIGICGGGILGAGTEKEEG
jgi:hypothetical protein